MRAFLVASRTAVVAAFLSLSGCIGSVASTLHPPVTVQGSAQASTHLLRATIHPRMDYHEHLNSPFEMAIAERITPVALPADLRSLLREREELAGKAEAAKLFAENGEILEWGSPSRWVHGREAIAKAVQSFASGYRYVPTSSKISGGLASITGVTARGDGTNETYGTSFALVLQKDRSGLWRIASEFLSARNSPKPAAPFTADDLIKRMNDAGIERAVVISSAHTIGSPLGPPLSPATEYERVGEENDWAAAQVARHPNRLVGFCGVNALRDWAIEEMRRCSAALGVKGIKLHFFTSQIDLLNPDHVAKLKRVFGEANALKMPLLVHAFYRSTHGRQHAEVMLQQLLAVAPDVPIQIAHLALSYDNEEGVDAALGVFADAIANQDPRTRNLYFDMSIQPHPASSNDEITAITKRLRQIGMDRILFGSDGPDFPRPALAWADFKWRMSLTDEELSTIANNVTSYLRP